MADLLGTIGAAMFWLPVGAAGVAVIVATVLIAVDGLRRRDWEDATIGLALLSVIVGCVLMGVSAALR